MSEYRGFMEEYGWDRESFPFVLFCFYRRLVPAGLVGNDLYEAVNDIVPNLDSRNMKEKPFIDFKAKFLSNDFEILA
ncbi:hypothetical protein GCM10023091_43050 [Ravibacter arvi]|uniref:Uncharacterized protein n=2 Tax=Ravibacter arvi TaxID=2051041 RepID=A0ABP8MEU4_9BACT